MAAPIEPIMLLMGAFTGLIAGAAVPAAGSLLKKKETGFRKYHREMAQAVAGYHAETGGYPDPKEKSSLGVQGIWFQNCAAAAACGTLSHIAAEEIAAAGLKIANTDGDASGTVPDTGATANQDADVDTAVDTAASAADEDATAAMVAKATARSHRARYDAQIGRAESWLLFVYTTAIGFAGALAAIGALEPYGIYGQAASATGNPGQTAWIVWLWAIAGALAIAIMLICDLRARVIPLEANMALAATGAVFTTALYGPIAALLSVAGGAACWAVMALFGRYTAKFTGEHKTIGSGDQIAAAACFIYLGPSMVQMAPLPPIAGAFTANPSLIGLIAALAVYLVCLIVLMASGRLRRRDLIPLATFFAMWGSFGVAAACL